MSLTSISLESTMDLAGDPVPCFYFSGMGHMFNLIRRVDENGRIGRWALRDFSSLSSAMKMCQMTISLGNLEWLQEWGIEYIGEIGKSRDMVQDAMMDLWQAGFITGYRSYTSPEQTDRAEVSKLMAIAENSPDYHPKMQWVPISEVEKGLYFVKSSSPSVRRGKVPFWNFITSLDGYGLGHGEGAEAPMFLVSPDAHVLMFGDIPLAIDDWRFPENYVTNSLDNVGLRKTTFWVNSQVQMGRYFNRMPGGFPYQFISKTGMLYED